MARRLARGGRERNEVLERADEFLPPQKNKICDAPPRPGHPGHAPQDLLGAPALERHVDAQVGEDQVDGGRGCIDGTRGRGRAAVAAVAAPALVVLAPVGGHRLDARAAQGQGGAGGGGQGGGDDGRANEEVGELAHFFFFLPRGGGERKRV